MLAWSSLSISRRFVRFFPTCEFIPSDRISEFVAWTHSPGSTPMHRDFSLDQKTGKFHDSCVKSQVHVAVSGFPSVVDFGREVCCDPASGEAREWLVTNGIGGYAFGTVSGHLTRS